MKQNVLFLDEFNPPTNDVKYACDVLLDHPNVSSVWICPIGEDKNVVDLCNVFCQQFYLENGRQLTCCTMAVDRKMSPDELVSWVRCRYPSEQFVTASFSNYCVPIKDKNPRFRFVFVAEDNDFLFSDHGGVSIPLSIRKAPSVAPLIKERIKAGKDESQKMYRVVWEQIQRRKLYRG